jgi:hypothetical protein
LLPSTHIPHILILHTRTRAIHITVTAGIRTPTTVPMFTRIGVGADTGGVIGDIQEAAFTIGIADMRGDRGITGIAADTAIGVDTGIEVDTPTTDTAAIVVSPRPQPSRDRQGAVSRRTARPAANVEPESKT